MELKDITWQMLVGVILVALAIGGVLVSVTKIIDAVKALRKPRKDKDDGLAAAIRVNAEAIASQQKMLGNDKALLEAHTRDINDIRMVNQMQLRAINALIGHEISGNGVDKLKGARDEISDYLIGHGV